MKYELAPFPFSLFDEGGLRKTQKSTLYKVFSDSENSFDNSNNIVYVVDGGMLLHRVPWKTNEKFSTILDRYVE